MIKHVARSVTIKAQGNKPKNIEEFIGRVSTQTQDLSIALMTSPAGWVEPGQMPEFDEYTVVLPGLLRVQTRKEMPPMRPRAKASRRKNTWATKCKWPRR
jgi:hypothetical protein